MPRELGMANRADLTGHFAGEPSEQVSSLTNFLVNAAQLAKPADAASAGGNGRHETDTDVPGRQTEGPGHLTEVPHKHNDTEVSGRLHPGGNGHAQDTVFDSPLPTLDMEPESMEPEAMEPEALLTPEPLDQAEPAGVAPSQMPPRGARTEALRPPPARAPQPALAPTPEPEAMPEPEALDSIPDFSSPEHDAPMLDEESAEPVTDKLPPRTSSPRVPDLPPPSNAGDTGMLTMDAELVPEANQLTSDELRADEDTNLQVGLDPSEKITSKVEPRVDIDPRARDPEAVVRDTVNFYNQTQSLHQRKSGQEGPPRVAGTVPLAPRPREFEDSPSRRFTPPPPLPAAQKPVSHPAPKPSLDPEELPQAPSLDSDDLLSAEPMGMAELSADDDIDIADRKDTDRFMEDDRRPPDLPKPVGSDRIAAAAVRPAPAGQVPQLDAVASEKVAAGKDTQKFFVADILRKKEEPKSASDSTGELQPETVRPPAGETSTDTAFEVGTERHTVREPKADLEPDLPSVDDVEKDFDTGYFGKSSERIVPEYEGVPEEVRGQADDADDDLDDDESQIAADEKPVDRITEKVSKAEEPELPTAPVRPAAGSGRPAVPSSAGRMPATTRPASSPHQPMPVAAQRTRTPRISDEVARQLAAEREETLRLLDAAEELATRLRSASEQSRADLVAISSRRRAAPLSELVVPAADDEPRAEIAPPDAAPTRILSARDYPVDEKPTTPVTGLREGDAVPPSDVRTTRTRRERVPTQAIGDIVSAIESKLGGGTEPLSELLQEASRRITRRIEAEDDENGNGNGHAHEPEAEDPYADMDMDQLVAASAALRAVVEAEQEAEQESMRDDEAQDEPAPASSARVVAESPLSQDLDRMWKELSTRKTAVVSTVEPARITQRHEIAPGWTQDALWKTLAGIALVTFVLGGFFVWIVYKLFS